MNRIISPKVIRHNELELLKLFRQGTSRVQSGCKMRKIIQGNVEEITSIHKEIRGHLRHSLGKFIGIGIRSLP